MKAFTRKARASERGNLLRTGGGLHVPLPPPQHGAIISMVEEAAPVMICEIKNAFDSDGTILKEIDVSQEFDLTTENNDKQATSLSIETLDILDTKQKIDCEGSLEFQENSCSQIEYTQNGTDSTCKKTPAVIKSTDQVRIPTDYIRREAVMRIKYLENKKKMEMQILKTQLEAEQIKKRAALLEEETKFY